MVGQMAQRHLDKDDDIDVVQLLLVIWRGKALIVFCVVVAVMAGAFLIASTFATYQADALLQLEERGGQLVLPSALQGLTNDSPESTTEIEVLRSRMILSRAVAELNLDWRVEPALAPVIGTIMARYSLPIPEFGFLAPYARPNERVDLALLSVPPSWFNTDLFMTVTEHGFEIALPNDEVLHGAVGDTIQREELGFAISIADINAPVGRQFTIVQIDERQAIEAVRTNLSVTERGRGSGILEVRFSGPNSTENIRILNAILLSYVQQNVARSAAEAQSSLEFINSQLPEAEQTLRRAEAALNSYRQQQVAIDLTFETENILTQINTVETQLSELQRQEDEISQRYTSSHPTYRQLLDERERLESRLAELRVQAGALPETQREILNLSRDLELAQGIYTELLTRRQEVEVLRASTVGNVRIIDSAAAAREKIAPRSSMALMISLFLGLMTGIGLVLGRSWLRKGVQDATELEALGLPVFATINYSAIADTGGARRGKPKIIALTDPTDLSIEAYRSMRTSLHFGMLDARNKAVAVTSSHPGAGKSFSAVNFAVVAAQAGQKVCLIDADMRRGYLRRYFGVGSGEGLADILAGDRDLEKCLVEGPTPNLFFLQAGKYPPNPSELLMRKEFRELIATLNEFFDLIILDCPPVLAVTDPVVISQTVGTTILVVRHDLTPAGEIEAAIKTFETAGQKLSGAILNGFDPKKAKAGYGYGYGYRYSYLSHEGDRKK